MRQLIVLEFHSARDLHLRSAYNCSKDNSHITITGQSNPLILTTVSDYHSSNNVYASTCIAANTYRISKIDTSITDVISIGYPKLTTALVGHSCCSGEFVYCVNADTIFIYDFSGQMNISSFPITHKSPIRAIDDNIALCMPSCCELYNTRTGQTMYMCNYARKYYDEYTPVTSNVLCMFEKSGSNLIDFRDNTVCNIQSPTRVDDEVNLTSVTLSDYHILISEVCYDNREQQVLLFDMRANAYFNMYNWNLRSKNTMCVWI